MESIQIPALKPLLFPLEGRFSDILAVDLRHLQQKMEMGYEFAFHRDRKMEAAHGRIGDCKIGREVVFISSSENAAFLPR